MNILFFASLKERLGCSELELEIAEPCEVEAIRQQLMAKGEPWSSALSAPNLLIAVNQEVSNAQTIVQQGDELAFFPPVTGG
jgi:molybdopterin synthase sulfur carrier subunit